MGTCQRTRTCLAWAGAVRRGRNDVTGAALDGKSRTLRWSRHALGGTSGYSIARLVTLMALRSHILAGARFGALSTHETVLAEEMWSLIPDHSLAIVDRGFFSARILIGLERGGIGRHWLTRARSDLKCTRIERFAAGDELVELTVSREARKKATSMPETWRMRAIRYQRRGFEPQLLLTSMLDPKRFPGEEIVALYTSVGRWSSATTRSNA
jgi:hypothetical protein